MEKYIKPTIKIRQINEESALLQASGTTTITGTPSNDLGSSTREGNADGASALSRQNTIFWDDENE